MSYLPARISADVMSRLRDGLFTTFTRASWGEQARDKDGYLQELMINQAQTAATGALSATDLVTSFLMFAALIISAFAINPGAAFVVIGAAIALALCLRPMQRVGRRRADAWSQASLNLASGVSEAVRLADVTKAFGVGEAERGRIAGLVHGVYQPYFHTRLLIRLVPGLYQSTMYVLVLGGLSFLYAVSSHGVASLGALILLLVRAGSYGQAVEGTYQSLLQSLPYLDRVRDAEDRYANSAAREGRRPLDVVETIVLEDVWFGYDRAHPVLRGAELAVLNGEATGIVGPSGVGKSTLIQILLGLRPPSRGRYLVNGADASAFAPEDWHRQFAYVPQEPQLLHASVTQNIRFFRDVDQADVERSARLAGIHDEIMQWPHGYETIIGQRADAVSGGQKQRISLARALAARPTVLVLDEPTSALDAESERVVVESLAALKGELTLFVVTHRAFALKTCDRLLAVIDGVLEQPVLETEARAG